METFETISIIVIVLILNNYRGVYCALAIAKLLRIPIYTDEDQGSNLFADSVAWILSCQNYEGGFGAAPGHEAHGGYTFCGVAVLAILDKLHLCNIDALLRWVSNRQMKYEGGFSGRYSLYLLSYS